MSNLAVVLGLVNRVVPAGEALATAREVASAVGKQGRLAVHLAKPALNAQGLGTGDGQPLEGLAPGDPVRELGQSAPPGGVPGPATEGLREFRKRG